LGYKKDMKQRDTTIDALGSFMIIYMIYGHLCNWAVVPQIPWVADVLFIFMPFFFLKGGLFFRKQEDKILIINGWHRLLVPYIIYSMLGQLMFSIRFFLSGVTDWRQYVVAPIRQILHEGACAGNAPLWFLLSLFVVRLLFNQCLKMKYTGILPVLAIVTAWGLNKVGFCDYYIVASSLSGLFFYWVGYMLKDILYSKATGICCCVLYLLLILLFPTYVDMRSNTVGHGIYAVWIINSILGFIAWIFFFSNISLGGVTYIGRHSMTYYVWHWVVFGFLQVILVILGFDDVSGFSRFWLFAIVTVIILSIITSLSIRRDNTT